AFSLAFLAGILDFIPILGPIIAGAVAFILSQFYLNINFYFPSTIITNSPFTLSHSIFLITFSIVPR
ncbi:unnamed protein product, partial [marine sediment metagenome]